VFLPLILHRAIPTVRFARASTQVTTERTRDRTGCAGANPARARARAITQRPDAPLPAITQHQIISSKHPEVIFHDRTRPLRCDQTQARVRSFFSSTRQRFVTDISIRHLLTGRRPYASGHIHCLASDQKPKVAFTARMTRLSGHAILHPPTRKSPSSTSCWRMQRQLPATTNYPQQVSCLEPHSSLFNSLPSQTQPPKEAKNNTWT